MSTPFNVHTAEAIQYHTCDKIGKSCLGSVIMLICSEIHYSKTAEIL